MNCEQVQALSVAYLDKEISPSERTLIQAHLSGCIVCQEEMASLSAAQTRVRTALQRCAASEVPSPEAWNRLEARLAREVRPSSAWFSAWVSRLAPDASRASKAVIQGGITMRKKFVLATSVAVLVLGLLSVSLFKSATPVSAQEVLRRSYAAQQAAEANPGIQHTRTEMYSNPRVIPGPKGMYGRETRSIVESFFDLQSGKNRVVIRDAETGQVTEVWGFDGNYVYSSKVPAPHQVDDTLRVYRAPQPAGTKNLWALKANGGLVNEKDVFEAAVKDPTAQILGQETWTDGRTVHVLRLQQLGKAVLADSQAHDEAPPMITTMYFDSQTFQLVEQQMTIQREGKEILFYSSRQLVQETLPVTTGVAWDFRDLANVRVVDDPEGEHGDLLPAPISAEKLASRVKSAYRLRAVPEGFVMQMSAPPKSKADEPDVYAVEYRNDAGDYLHIQGGTLGADPPIQNADETYTTASGLVVSFVAGRERAVGDKRVTYAIVQAPDGTAFELTSSLPRERAKALAEELVPVR